MAECDCVEPMCHTGFVQFSVTRRRTDFWLPEEQTSGLDPRRRSVLRSTETASLQHHLLSVTQTDFQLQLRFPRSVDI